jgi:hypothetical protein
MGAEDRKTDDVVESAGAAAGVALETMTEGTLNLLTPIKGGGKEITALPFNFMTLTGWEIAEAMDGDKSAGNAFRISYKQALLLFAAAAAKLTPELDATDIRQRLMGPDAINAVRLSEVFYHASALRRGQTS